MKKGIKYILISSLLIIPFLNWENDGKILETKAIVELVIQEENVLVEEIKPPVIKNAVKIDTNSQYLNENGVYNNLSSNGGRVQLYENEFGTKLDGYDYDVVLPDGVPTVEAPNVIGMTLEEANSWSMLNLNRNVTIFGSECVDQNAAPGSVVRQSPAPGSLIPNDYNVLTTNSITTGLTVWLQADNCEEIVSE